MVARKLEAFSERALHRTCRRRLLRGRHDVGVGRASVAVYVLRLQLLRAARRSVSRRLRELALPLVHAAAMTNVFGTWLSSCDTTAHAVRRKGALQKGLGYMSGESDMARELVRKAMAIAEQDRTGDRDAMGRALISAVLAEYAAYRTTSDVAAELQYFIDNLDEDFIVVTRGC